MTPLTKEQIAQAKQWDLLSYLQTYEPQELKKSGLNEYCTVTHDSLKISRGKWCWNSRGIGGKTALDYLIHVRGMDFVGAVQQLTGGYIAPYITPTHPPMEKPKRPFTLPQAARCATHMVAYLQGRGIDANIISHCIGEGILYESKRYHNCVFVGKDPDNIPRFASLRGVGDNFRMDVESSDKRYNFCLPSTHANSTSLVVAESPVDALSLATLMRMQGEDWTQHSYLSLGGTAPRALLQYLADHPQITHISLCLDNDKAGLSAIKRLTDAVLADQTLAARIALIHPNPPPIEHGKDYNQLLQAKVAALRTEKNTAMIR